LLFDVRKIVLFQIEARGIIECRSTVNKKKGFGYIIEGWLKPRSASCSFNEVGLIAAGMWISSLILLFFLKLLSYLLTVYFKKWKISKDFSRKTPLIARRMQ